MAENPETPVGTPAQRSAAAQSLQAFLAQGGSPQARGVGAPPDQAVVAWFDENNKLRFTENPNHNPEAPKTTVYGSADGGYFVLGPDGTAVTVQQPNADAIIDKAVDRQIKEGDRNARARNETATGYYITDTDRARLENDLAKQGLDRDTLNQRIKEFGVATKQKDLEEARLAAKTKSDIALQSAQIGQVGAQTGLIGAQTVQTGATTAQTQAQTAALQAKTPAEVAEAKARTAQIEQQTEDARRKAGQPTVTQLGEGATYGVMGPTGQITEQMRQGYVPKTLAEVQARVGQIQQAYNAKKQELFGKIGANYTAEQADKELGVWYDQNVTPQQQMLQQAQEEALYQRAKDEAAAKVTAYNAAQAAGTNQVSAFNAMKTHALGPGAAGMINSSLNAINKAAGRPEQDYSALVTQGPNVMESSQAAVDRALAQLSPSAAMRTGQPQPNYQGMDIAGALNQIRYQPPGAGGPPAGGPPAGGPPAGPPAGGAPPIQMPDWLRGDQNPGPTPPGNALAVAGQAGTVPMDAPQRLGVQATPEQIAAAAAAANYQFPG